MACSNHAVNMLVLWCYSFVVFINSVSVAEIDAIDYEVGDNCSLISGQKGICTDIDKCSHATNLLTQGRKPKICGFDGLAPIVCCPVAGTVLNISESATKEQRISERECYNFYPYPVYPIIATGDRDVSSFKHMALIGYEEKNNFSWTCAGSLVSLNFVMTAAHCINSRTQGPVKWVRLGSLTRFNDTDGREPQHIRIKKLIPHPAYKPPSRYHDIALLELETPAKRTNFVAPACLDTNRTHNEKQMIATGWGKTSAFEDLSNKLLKANLDLVPVDRCKQFYRRAPPNQLPNGIDDDLQICAGGGPQQDTCQGDSGGPLQIVSPHKSLEKPYMIVGITSFGKLCGLTSSPGVYTRVYSHLTWLEQIIWSTE